MSGALDVLSTPVFLYLLVLTRVGGVFTAAPFLGTNAVPIRFRAMLALGLTAVVTPLVSSWQVQAPTPPKTLIALVPMLVYELSAGMAMGLGAFTGPQHLHGSPDGLHDVSAGVGVHVFHHDAVEGRAIGDLRIADQSLVSGSPFIFEQR